MSLEMQMQIKAAQTKHITAKSESKLKTVP